MKNLLFTLFIASTGFMVGCDQSSNDEPTPETGPKKLMKITTTEAGQSKITNLTYDANGRLATSKIEGHTENITYSYNSAGDLSKIEAVDGSHKMVFEVTYNGGTPVKSTLKMYDGEQIYNDSEYTYTVENGLVTRIVEKLEGTPWLQSDITYSGTNIAKIQTISLAGNDNFNTTVTYTYGNKKNFFGQNGFKFLLDTELTLPFFIKNEILNEKHTGNIDHTYEILNTYTYDSDGYPLTLNSIQTGPGQSSRNFKFDYQ